jgi:hypothetical protein
MDDGIPMPALVSSMLMPSFDLWACGMRRWVADVGKELICNKFVSPLQVKNKPHEGVSSTSSTFILGPLTLLRTLIVKYQISIKTFTLPNLFILYVLCVEIYIYIFDWVTP